ncbi:MAG TPA: DoxX family protein [Saprospiraceae bacterium]|nr:DoxX family protein [Saprospiraceae bacterium]
MSFFKYWLNPGNSEFKMDIVLFMLRIVFGGFMLLHGYSKLQSLLSGSTDFPDPIGIGPQSSLALTVFAEFLCALLVIFGLMTKLALIPLMITMMVAAFIVHAQDPIGDKEQALLYLFAYYAIYLAGPGRFSLDHKIFKP